MELALSLGDQSRSPKKMKELGFCMGLGSSNSQINDHNHKNFKEKNDDDKQNRSSSSDLPPLQLDLLPYSPPPPLSHRHFPWLSRILIGESGSQIKLGKGLDVKPLRAVYDPDINGEEPGTIQSSPNDELDQRVSSRRAGYGGTSDEDDNGFGRKKLRLSKEQSDFLEDSFKEHNTLNPKQKLVLANQLNLRPRQVEVWFQNRRARTKLKQTEVDCEYLKTCCETLTEENHRLQKELQELRAIKTFQPFYTQLPPTMLTMCPSCERVVTTTSASTTAVPKQPASGCP